MEAVRFRLFNQVRNISSLLVASTIALSILFSAWLGTESLNWQIVMAIGESAPLLIVEGHDTVRFSHLHYGLFQRLEPYEREEPEDTRWGLSIRDWG